MNPPYAPFLSVLFSLSACNKSETPTSAKPEISHASTPIGDAFASPPAIPVANKPGRTWYVSTTGSDAAEGSEAAPLKTIQAAATKAAPGDAVSVAKGIYRETVRPANSGTAENPILFTAESGTVIDGSDPVSGWTGNGGVFTAPMAGDWFSRATPGDGVNLFDSTVSNQADQIFVDGRMMLVARWPNSPTLDPSFPAKAVCEKFISKTRDAKKELTTSVMQDEEFDLPAATAVGAQIMVQPNWGAWSWIFTGWVTEVQKNQFTFTSRNDSGKDFNQTIYADKSRYFLFDKLELLDAPGEWYHDKKSGILHLMSPDDKPLEGRVTAKRREFGFDLSERSHILIKGFSLHACTLTTDSASGGDNVPYDAAGKARYPWRNSARSLPTEPYFRDDFKDAPSTGVMVSDCSFTYPSHFTDVSGHFECQWSQSSGVVLSGTRHVIMGCHVRHSAGTGIVLLGREHRALGNLVEDVNYAATDSGAFHTGVTQRASTDHEIGWNTVRRCGRSGIMIRQMTRRDCADGSLWKGRIHHNDVSGFGIQDWDLGGICSTGYDGHYVRIDHNWVYDAHENVDNIPGAGGFTAGGIYLDYSHRFLVDHNIVWNVEWGIHLQNQTVGAKTAGFVVVNNTVAVRMLGGNPSLHGPYGVVKNSDASFQDTLIADNLLLLTDDSAKFKPVDFESDSRANRIVENNLTSKRFDDIGLSGGTKFPAALQPANDAPPIKDKGKVRKPPTILELTVPDWNRSFQGKAPDLGATEAGETPWRPGHEFWSR